jgi:hypothetical protein
MTTQARELAGIISNAGDLNFSDDITLGSDGAVLNFGADSDVSITHVADTALLLNSTRQLQFGDSGTYINQSADGVLNLTSDTEVEINATTVDINANVDISGNIVLGGTITVGDADTDNMIINANVNSHIIPNTDDTYDLGSTGQQWRNLYIDGTVEADAITIGGVTLSETIADTVGAMTTSNTESGITVAYDDADNTLDFTVGTLNQDTTGTASLFTASANNSTDETVYPVFVDGATGSQGAETDTGLTYNPSTGMLTSTGVTATFTGNITGNVTGNTSGTAATVTTAAQTNITSLGTLTALTVDNIIINGTTIGHTSDTDSISIASNGIVTFSQIPVLPANSIDSDHYVDASIDNAHLADDAVGVAELSATGTASNSTYLRGDNSWAALTAASITSYTNSTNNRILTSVDSATVNSEANLTFDGSTLAVTGAITASGAITANGGAVFNETSLDRDFRVESNGNANMLFVDGGTDAVGIGTNAPVADGALHVVGANGILVDTDGNGDGSIYFGHNAGSDRTYLVRSSDDFIINNVSAGNIRFYNNNVERMRLDASGNLALGHTTTTGSKFAICDGANAQIQFFPEVTTDTNLIQHYDPTASAYMNADYRAATHQFKIGTSEHMRIHSDGKVGIGTASPAARLDIAGMAAGEQALLITTGRNDALSNGLARINITDANCPFTGLQIDHAGTGSALTVNGKVTIANTSAANVNNESHILIRNLANGDIVTDGILWNSGEDKLTVGSPGTFITSGYIRSGAADMSFGTASQGAYITLDDSEGDVLIAPTGGVQIKTPHQGDTVGNLNVSSQVASSPSTSENCLIIVKNGGQSLQFMAWSTLGARIGTRTGGWHNTGTQNVYFTTQDSVRLTMTHSSGVVSGDLNDTSDQRLKKDITTIGDTTAKLKQLNPVNFKWKENDTVSEGFIAQEVETIFPELINTGQVIPNEELDTAGMASVSEVKSINTVGLLAKAIKTIQELEARITTLEG